jgi:hypothetical protein
VDTLQQFGTTNAQKMLPDYSNQRTNITKLKVILESINAKHAVVWLVGV